MLCKNFNKCFNNKSFVLHSGKRSIQNPIKHLKSCFGKIFNNITSITRSFHIFMLWQSGWQITTFCHKIYIFGFNLLEAILKWGWLLASESRIYRFYDKKVVICHPLGQKINMWKLLVLLVVIKLYARIDILKIFNGSKPLNYCRIRLRLTYLTGFGRLW